MAGLVDEFGGVTVERARSRGLPSWSPRWTPITAADNADDGPAAPRPRALVLHARDNVAVAVAALEPGEKLDLQGLRVTVREPIPFGHKLALRDLGCGGEVVKYGEAIGVTTAAIAAGRHVHVHNVASRRLPGPSVPL